MKKISNNDKMKQDTRQWTSISTYRNYKTLKHNPNPN